MHNFLIFLLFGGIYGLPEFAIQRIKNDVGLYYERLQDTHLVLDEWKLVTFFDLRPIEIQRPRVSQIPLDKVEKECQTFLFDRCTTLINKKEIRSKTELIEKYLNFIYKLDRKTLIDTGRVPLRDAGTTTEELFEDMPEAEVAFYNKQFKKLNLSTEEIIALPNNLTHIVKSGYQAVGEQLEGIELHHNKIWEAINMMPRNESKEFMEEYVSRIFEWKNSVELVTEAYLSKLGTTIDIIYFAKMGLFHPELLSTKTLEKVALDFTTIHYPLSFPVPPADRPEALMDISRFTVTYQEGKIIVIMYIPLIDPNSYSMYKLHPFPTLQTIGNYTEVAAFIQPKTSTLMLSWEYNKYTVFSEEELNHCRSNRDYKICVPRQPIYDMSQSPICETLIFTGNLSQIYDNCDIKLAKSQITYWKQLGYTNQWLFSLPDREEIKIKCGNSTQTRTVAGKGIMHLRKGCAAHNDYMNFVSVREIGVVHKDQYLPAVTLNISQLFPNVSNYQQKLNIILPMAYRPTMVHDATGLRCEITLKELLRHFREYEEYRLEGLAKNTLLKGIICAIIVLGALLLTLSVFIGTLNVARLTTNTERNTETESNECNECDVLCSAAVMPLDAVSYCV